MDLNWRSGAVAILYMFAIAFAGFLTRAIAVKFDGAHNWDEEW